MRKPKAKPKPKPKPKARINLGGVRFDYFWPARGAFGGTNAYLVAVTRRRRKVSDVTIPTRDGKAAAGWTTALLDAAEDAARAAKADGLLTADELLAVADAADKARRSATRKEARARKAGERAAAETAAEVEEADPFAAGRTVADDFEPF